MTNAQADQDEYREGIRNKFFGPLCTGIRGFLNLNVGAIIQYLYTTLYYQCNFFMSDKQKCRSYGIINSMKLIVPKRFNDANAKYIKSINK